MSKVDYCLKCPEWGGDGLCDGGWPDDPSESWCARTFGGEYYINENPLEFLEPDSPEYFEALWEDLKTVPFGEEIFMKNIKRKRFEQTKLIEHSKTFGMKKNILKPRFENRREYVPTVQIEFPIGEVQIPQPRDMLGELLIEIHQKKGSLSFNKVLDLLKERYGRKLTFSEKNNATDRLRTYVKIGKLNFKDGKTYIK